jgi:hypothetical protein
MAEQLTCNQQVAGSIPAVGSGVLRGGAQRLASDRRAHCEERRKRTLVGALRSDERARGEMGCDRRSPYRGSSSVGRASAFQAERRGFDSRLPLWSFGRELASVERGAGRRARSAERRKRTSGTLRSGARARGEMPHALRSRSAQVAQSAEHVLGKDEVGGSIPLLGLLNREARGPVERRCGAKIDAERYPSGQREQTVNLPAYAFGGSNPPLSMEEDGYRLPTTGDRKGAGESLAEGGSRKPVAPVGLGRWRS